MKSQEEQSSAGKVYIYFGTYLKKKEKKISVGQTLVITIYWSYLSLYVHSCHYPKTKIIGIDLACSASWQGGVGIDVGDTQC